MKRISNRLAQSGALDMVATATPGIKDVLILGKVKQLQRNSGADVIFIDAPAAGHAISFLRSARGLRNAVSVGPIESQAREVDELLTDASRCQVMLVTLPEETPVNELVDTAFALEDDIGIALGPIVVNGRYPDRPGLAVSVTDVAASAGVTVSPAHLRDGAGGRVPHRASAPAGRTDRAARRIAATSAAGPAVPLHRRAGIRRHQRPGR